MAVRGPGIVVPKMENVGSQFLSLRQRQRVEHSPTMAAWRKTALDRVNLDGGRSVRQFKPERGEAELA
jgi:hypothetical protein